MWKTQKIIIGIDESGRGPLAGPVVAAAVYTPQCLDIRYLNIVVRDSKKMTARQREQSFEFLKGHADVEWGIGRAGERVIDKINILEATKLAMIRAVNNLFKNMTSILHGREEWTTGREMVLLIDGNIKLDTNKIKAPASWTIRQIPIVKGDQKVPIISMASIIAKVSRDRAMVRYGKKYPEYNFSQHKGYPTKEHYQTLLVSGSCKIHRQSFRLD